MLNKYLVDHFEELPLAISIRKLLLDMALVWYMHRRGSHSELFPHLGFHHYASGGSA